MLTKIKHGDSEIICFDYGLSDYNELNNLVLSNFDIINMPVKYMGKTFIGDDKYSPCYFELDNYNVCFYQDHLSKTGYSCMCINKDRQIYKSKIGYNNE